MNRFLLLLVCLAPAALFAEAPAIIPSGPQAFHRLTLMAAERQEVLVVFIGRRHHDWSDHVRRQVVEPLVREFRGQPVHWIELDPRTSEASVIGTRKTFPMIAVYYPDASQRKWQDIKIDNQHALSNATETRVLIDAGLSAYRIVLKENPKRFRGLHPDFSQVVPPTGSVIVPEK